MAQSLKRKAGGADGSKAARAPKLNSLKLAAEREAGSSAAVALAEAQEQSERDKDLAAIMAELVRCPDKIKPCRIDVESDKYLKKRPISTADKISANVLCIRELDEKFLEAWFIRRDSRFGAPGVLKELWKKDHGVLSKIMVRVHLCVKEAGIVDYNVAAFDEKMGKRAADLKCSFGVIKWSDEYVVDWASSRIYGLRPPRPEDHEGKWFFKTLVFNNVYELDIEELYVTDAWQIDENWSVKDAGLHNNAPEGAMHRSHKAVELFSKHTEVKGIVKSVKITTIDDGQRKDDAPPPSPAVASESSSPATPASTLGDRPRFSDKDLGLIQKMRARAAKRQAGFQETADGLFASLK